MKINSFLPKGTHMMGAMLAMSTAFVFTSCSDDNSDTEGHLALKAQASYENNLLARTFSNVTLTDVLVNIREIEFEIDDDMYDDMDDDDMYDDDGFFDSDDEIELQGPFELNLLANENAIEVTNISVPNNTYEEIEFEIGKSTNINSELYNKSILTKGSIGDTPFVFWHNIDEEVEVDFEDTARDIVIDGGNNSIVINFDLNQIFGAASGIDFSSATDGNADGTIEISPTDSDGNNDLADAIRAKIKDVIDLLDD